MRLTPQSHVHLQAFSAVGSSHPSAQVLSLSGLSMGQIRFELFLILFLINIGTFFISSTTGKAIIRSFTNEIDETNRLKIEATIDSLTQLLNRNGLEQAAGTTWALCKRDKKNVGVILADIDYFKSYNDTLGHPEGDNILKQVAESIKSCFRRDTDIISRIGGDEFLIFLSDINDDHVFVIFLWGIVFKNFFCYTLFRAFGKRLFPVCWRRRNRDSRFFFFSRHSSHPSYRPCRKVIKNICSGMENGSSNGLRRLARP